MALPPMKLAIVGAGPSAFYVASRILSRIKAPHPQASTLRIHMYDRLWAPHGLVRYGVAPDHPEVKNCTHKFDSTAVDSRFRFFGNVNIGSPSPTTPPDTTQLSIPSLLKSYTHLLLSTGCPAPTLHPSLTLSPYCIPALSLVHWYTQHPSLSSTPPLDKINHVTIIGNGNVALDIARILLTPPSLLSKYDVPVPVLELLSRSTVKHVSIIARRGPRDAAFTTKELREMMNLTEASMIPVHPPSLLDIPTSSLDALSRQQSRVLQLLQKGSVNKPGTTQKTWSLEFFRCPTNIILPSPSSPKPTLTLTHTNPELKLNTPETSSLQTDLVITSLGFHPEPTSPFQTRGNGVSFASTDSSPPALLKNVYSSGWAATGAKGVLAATMINAYGVADTILADWLDGEDMTAETKMEEVMNPNPALDDVPVEIQEAIHQGNVIDYTTWKSIDAEEVRRGEVLGKERERMVRLAEIKKFLARK